MAVDFYTMFDSRYPTGATQIYVDQAVGSDTNPGTTSQPKATIQGGLAAVGASGKVWVRNGNYVMTDGSIPVKNGSASAWVQVCAVAGQTPRIQTPGNYQTLGIFNCSYVAFYGFEISGVANASQPDSVCVLVDNSHHIAIWKCNIHDGTHGIHTNMGHHFDICYNKVGPNLARYRTYGQGIAVRIPQLGGNDADGYSTRIIGNIVHDVMQDVVANYTGGSGIYIIDGSGRGAAGGTAGGDKFLIGFNLVVNNGQGGIASFSSDNMYSYFNTLAHNVRQAGLGSTAADLGELDLYDELTSNTKWNVISTRSGRSIAQWYNAYGSGTTAPLDNVILRGNQPAITGQRDRTATGDSYFKSQNDAMTNIDGWRPLTTPETVQLNTATGGTIARDALQNWPDWFGELRPTASGNTWALGWIEPTPVTAAPVANFTASPNPANIGQTITFTDTSTGTPTSWLWNFGDGTTSTLQNPTKSYSAAGTYNVSLTVTNGGGSNAKTVQVIVSAPQNTSPYEAENSTYGGGVEPPQVLTTNTGYSGSGYLGFFGRTGNFAQFSISGLAAGQYALQMRWGRADAGNAQRLIRVNGTAVSTLSISQTSTDWADPARFVLSTAITVTLTSGTNLIRVEYAGSDLQYVDLDRISLTPITTPSTPPVANFAFSPNNPTPGALISFTDTSSQSPTAWAWDFGDGTSSTLQNPTKAFTNPGTYTVTLTATNSSGSNARSQTVIVSGVVSGQPVTNDALQVTGNPLQNLTAYTAHVEVRDTNELIGADTEQFTTSWDPPAAPSFTVVP